MGKYSLIPNRPGILLVEDNPTEARLSLEILAQHSSNPEITWAKSGMEAISILSDLQPGQPRLILLDIKMPLMSGIDALTKIRELPAGQNTPILMFTSSRLPSDIRESYANGANAYIQKQVDYDEQVSTLSKTLDFWLGCNELE